MAKLRARVKSKAAVLRNGAPQMIFTDGVVVGDVMLLSAGSLIPGDFCAQRHGDDLWPHCPVLDVTGTGDGL